MLYNKTTHIQTLTLKDGRLPIVWRLSGTQITQIKKDLTEAHFELKEIASLRLMYHMGGRSSKAAYMLYIKYTQNFRKNQIISSKSSNIKSLAYKAYHDFIQQLIKNTQDINPTVSICYGHTVVTWTSYFLSCLAVLALPIMAYQNSIITQEEMNISLGVTCVLIIPFVLSMIKYFPTLLRKEQEIPSKVLPNPNIT